MAIFIGCAIYCFKYCASESNKYLSNHPQGHPRKLLADIFIVEVKIFRDTNLSVDYNNDRKSPVSRFNFRSMYRAASLGWRAATETRAGVECLGIICVHRKRKTWLPTRGQYSGHIYRVASFRLTSLTVLMRDIYPHSSLSGGWNLYSAKAAGELQTLILWRDQQKIFQSRKKAVRFLFAAPKNIFTDLFIPKQKGEEVLTDWRKCGLTEEKNTTMEATCNLWMVVLNLVVNSEGKRPFGRPRRKWDDNNKMDLLEVGMGVWNVSSWFRVAGTCECGNELSYSIKYREFLD